MTKRLLIGLFFMAIVLILDACYYDNEEELYPSNNCNTASVSYSSTILPIISNNCYSCHSNAARQGNVILEGYAALKVMVDNGKLEGAINHRSGFSPMPQGATKLIDCQLNQISSWINAGALNN